MTGNEAVNLAEKLAAGVHAINVSSRAGIFGVSPTDSALLQVRKTAADLLVAARGGSNLRPQIEQTEAALRSAQLVGLLSQSELEPYMKTIDNLYRITDKEQ